MTNSCFVSDLFEICMERIQSTTKAYTQVELAEILHIRQSSISDAKKRNSIPAKWLVTLLQKFRLNPDWVLLGEQPQYLEGTTDVPSHEIGTPKSTFPIHVPKRIKNKTVIVHSMSGSGTTGTPWEQKPVEQIMIPEHFYRPDMIVIVLESASLEPIIRKGSYIGIDPHQQNIISGELYAFDLPREGLVIRKAYVREDDDKILLSAFSQHFQEQALPFEFGQQRVFGRIVWILQEL
ncbi:LexA family transcriptional regulator [Desulfovibrio inopinatus]|uniref:LexA family transcriptional regulator n=1 Tax=Desulfovibrio inopinatus TaxID=102109 RepID=UPI00040A895A|nr:S24 family peptidase [Desulfovibrio inopinatus]